MKIKLFYHWQQYDWQEEGQLYISTVDISEHDKYSTLLKVEEVDIPGFVKPSKETLRSGIVKRLEQEKKELLADTHLRVSMIDEKINQLTCIENLEPA
ncbi:MAG TPA: hypothetical protein VIY48_06390 [Candidatus Paceibacterota bacterium]